MKTVITIVGLPGAGKTTVGDHLHKLIGGARINADQVRDTISCDLKFMEGHREIQAYRMGALAALALYEPIQLQTDIPMGSLNKTAIVDFICPTLRTRDVYEWALRSQMVSPVRRFTVWMDTIKPEQCRYADTAKLYQVPSGVDIQVKGYKTPDELATVAQAIAYEVRPDLFGARSL